MSVAVVVLVTALYGATPLQNAIDAGNPLLHPEVLLDSHFVGHRPRTQTRGDAAWHAGAVALDALSTWLALERCDTCRERGLWGAIIDEEPVLALPIGALLWWVVHRVGARPVTRLATALHAIAGLANLRYVRR